eukprot:gene913-920_t
MLLILMLTSKGVAGVPRASLVVIAGTLAMFNIPEAGLALLIGIDPLLDMGRSATNVLGNAMATAVYNSVTGAYQYVNKHDSLVKTTLFLTQSDLLYLHRKAADLGFWDFPANETSGDTMGYGGQKPPRYYIEFDYQRKSKKVLFDASYNGDEKLKDANVNLQLTYADWRALAKTEINLQPEYGNAIKTKEHLVKLGFTYLSNGDVKTAMERFNQAWLLDPKNENAYWGYGAIYGYFNDYDTAIAEYDKGLLINPNSPVILTDKATVYFVVAKDQQIFVHRLQGDEGASIEFDNVLLAENEGSFKLGSDLKSAKVSAKIKNGHRQQFTKIEITEMAHKKGAGSSRNGRESHSKRLGIKIFGGQPAIAGNIIVRQRGTKHNPGLNVGIGKDHTLFALTEGIVTFKKKADNRSYVYVLPFETAEVEVAAAPAPAVKAEQKAVEAKAPVAEAAAEEAPKAKKAAAPKKKAADTEEAPAAE